VLLVGQVIGQDFSGREASITKNNQIILFIPAKKAKQFPILNYTSYLQTKGYLYARFDSTTTYPDTSLFYFSLGKKYLWDYLTIRSSQRQNQSSIAQAVVVKPRELLDIQKKLIAQAENNGYPFAQVRLDSIEIVDSVIDARLILERGSFFIFDSLQLQGNLKIKPSFVAKYVFIKPGEPFSQKRVDNAEFYLKDLTFLKASPPDIIFAEEKARVIFPLESRKANQADGVIGLINNAGSNKLLITGELNIDLNNLLQSGKKLLLHYRRFNVEAQSIEFNYYHPVLIGPLDAKIDFSLLRQDTSFLNINRQGSLFIKNAKTRLGIFSGLKTSRRLSSNLSKENVSFDYYHYGFTYEWRNLNDFLMPREGSNLFCRFSTGNKAIIEELPPRFALRKKISQFLFDVKFEHYFTRKHYTFYGSCSSGMMYNINKAYLLGDFYRLGGLKTLRGFNENYFFSSSYIISNLEYRFYTEVNSYIFIFYDQGLLKNQSKLDFAMGFGPGISFKSNAGIFNFVFALGRSHDQSLRLNLAKIHFGYVSTF
jgi:outer membrane protein assembly factor BamA